MNVSNEMSGPPDYDETLKEHYKVKPVVGRLGRKQYLGDGVYVDLEHGMIKLTTENGYGASNTIYLGSSEYEMLIKYVETLVP